ncbi:response regulator [bacterium]|nr:response regulator [bacterium]
MKILIIDDSKFMRTSMETRLKTYGFELFQAENGEAGIKLALAVRPDVILLDVRMPGIDGFETCRQLRQYDKMKKVPVIMVTVESDESAVKKAIQSGVTDYVLKPVNYDDLVKKLDKIMLLD